MRLQRRQGAEATHRRDGPLHQTLKFGFIQLHGNQRPRSLQSLTQRLRPTLQAFQERLQQVTARPCITNGTLTAGQVDARGKSQRTDQLNLIHRSGTLNIGSESLLLRANTVSEKIDIREQTVLRQGRLARSPAAAMHHAPPKRGTVKGKSLAHRQGACQRGTPPAQRRQMRQERQMRCAQLAFYTGHRLSQVIAGKIAQTASTYQRTLRSERGEVLFGQFVPFGGTVFTGQQQALRRRFSTDVLAVGRLSGHRSVSRGVRWRTGSNAMMRKLRGTSLRTSRLQLPRRPAQPARLRCARGGESPRK